MKNQGQMMTQFTWNNSKQFGWKHTLIATFGPSVFAYTGFHAVTPTLVEGCTPNHRLVCSGVHDAFDIHLTGRLFITQRS
jgi:hypothetical protein